MSYFLILNNDKVVVDILTAESPLFVKMRQDGVMVGTDSANGTGIIGSDGNTHYKIAKKNIDLPENLYTIRGIEEMTEDIIIGYTKIVGFDINKDGYPIYETDIEQIQKDKQEENKAAFNNYLLVHPYEYNGKQYGTTLQDQLEINLMLSQAQAMTIGDEEPQVEWHATTEVNESMSVSDLLAIQAGIKNAVAASYKKMQEYKKAIFDCTDAKTLVEMSFEYEEGKNA